MMKVREYLRARLLSKVRPPMPAGIKEKGLATIEAIFDDHVAIDFLALMLNGLLFGYFRYGPRHVPGRQPTDNIKEVKRRIDLYKKTGNQEYLVDAANFCMVEYDKPCHPNPHFGATDDGAHAEFVGEQCK